MTRVGPVSMWGPNAQGVRSRSDRSVVLNPGDVERMGFDFDEFDAGIVEGTSEAEQNPWDLVLDPETGELVERSVANTPHSALLAMLAPWVEIRDAVGSYVANVEGFDWEDMATVEEMADQISHDILAEIDARPDHINDRIWSEIIQAGEHAGYEYDLGWFYRVGPDTSPRDVATTVEEIWEALGRTLEAEGLFDAGTISAEELERRRELSAEEMDRIYGQWRREDREYYQERAAQREDPRPHSGDEFFHEFQATPALTGLGGFQSPGMPSGPPGFQSPGVPSGVLGGSSVRLPALTGLGGFQSPGMPSGPPGFQSPGVPSGVLGGSSVRLPVSPPSVRRQSLPAGSPGFGVPDGLLRDLVSRMGGEPPRIGRQNPESSRDGRERGGDYKPGAPLSDEQRRINQRGLEEARDVLRRLGGSVGDMPLEHKLALAAALAGAGLLTVGTGGFAGPALMAGGGLSLLSNQ